MQQVGKVNDRELQFQTDACKSNFLYDRGKMDIKYKSNRKYNRALATLSLRLL